MNTFYSINRLMTLAPFIHTLIFFLHTFQAVSCSHSLKRRHRKEIPELCQVLVGDFSLNAVCRGSFSIIFGFITKLF